ncbi:3-keto-5-aminohexanoate cleavage protein [Kiloniella laminariae]|uniref:3-keto-5-aminohexanoate cleavage protein n=1 Tax=Kiloniella laminariae TaxID=454162 RepID=UPI000376C9E5|nr:3-keto-5-aminohexanoate cleavage protein [Kiloniella laminariae]
MNNEVIITCPVTGSGVKKDRHTNVPVTPEEISDAAIEAAKAGAAVAHLHVRNPDTGQASNDINLYAETVGLLRDKMNKSGVDVVINITAGMGGEFVPDPANPNNGGPGTDMLSPVDRLKHIDLLRPEICTLDCGSLNFSDYAYVSTPGMLREMCALIQKMEVKPEIEAFELGHIWMAKQLMSEGLIDAPPLFQLCLGIPYAAEANGETMLAMRNMLPEGANWGSFGVGPTQMGMAAQSVIFGGHVRVGLEDNLYLERGVLASNGQLVSRAKEIIERMGARTLSAEEARKKFAAKKQR